MATASVVLGVFVFLPVVSGLAAVLLGAVARRAIAAEPQRWRGTDRANAGLGLGLVFGVVPALVFAAVMHDEWGPAPVVVVLVFTGLVLAYAAGAGRSPVGAAGVAAAGVGGVAVMAVVAAGLATGLGLFVYWLIRETGSFVLDAFLGRAEQKTS